MFAIETHVEVRAASRATLSECEGYPSADLRHGDIIFAVKAGHIHGGRSSAYFAVSLHGFARLYHTWFAYRHAVCGW